MAYKNEEEINYIREHVDIAQIIGSYITLTKSGSDYVGVCPFHDDHSPSMHVSLKRNMFKCFVCNSGGNVFSFVQKFENVSYLEAVKIVADKSGISFNYDSSSLAINKFSKEYELMELSLKYYQNNLATSNGIEAKKYLLNRQIDDNIIKEFKIGLSLNNNKLKDFFNNKEANLDMANNIGLLNKDGINYYDTFIDRIMIPIFDMQNNLVGYTARCYLTNDKNKYINSRETIIYKKSNILFNYYNAKNMAREKKTIIIVEGNMDAISLSSFGIKNVIALMGVVISKYQIEAIRKLNSKVVLMLDNDDAGLTATIKVGDEILKEGLDLYVVRLSGSKDPDEYIRKNGVEKFNEILKNPQKYVDFKLEVLKANKNLENAADLTEYIKSALKTVENASDLEKEILIGKLSKEYNIDASIIRSNLTLTPKKVEIPSIQNVPKKKKSKYELGVKDLLYSLLLDKSFYEIYENSIDYLENKIERDTAKMIGAYIKKYNKIDIAGFLDYAIEYNEIFEYINNIVVESRIENITKNDFCDILNAINSCMREKQIKNIKEKIKVELDVNKKMELIEKLTRLKKGCGNDEEN